jgi:hypothetical protein
MTKHPREGHTETITVSEFWRLLAKSMGASDERAEDLVREMEACDEEKQIKNSKPASKKKKTNE